MKSPRPTTVNRDAEIDRTVDAVARALTDREPGAGFTAAVLDRIRRPAPWRPRAWLWAPLAATATVVLVLALREPATVGPPAALTARTVANVGEAIGGIQESFAIAAADDERRGGDGGSGAATVPVRGRPLSETESLAPPALAMTSLALPPIAAADSIVVPELETITPIAIEPIGDSQGARR
jgi:hypothetical protein